MNPINILITNAGNILKFLKEFTVDSAKDVSITYINTDGSESVKTLPNITKMWETFNITNDGGVIKDLDGRVLAYGGDSGWIDLKPYLVNGWEEYSTSHGIMYRVVGKTVFMRGLVKGGSDAIIFENLPSEIRPKYYLQLHEASHCEVNVVDGALTMSPTPDGSFRSSTYSTDWTSIACSYTLG